jgi:vacuolar-type H+-ATPase subunit E/Vma4
MALSDLIRRLEEEAASQVRAIEQQAAIRVAEIEATSARAADIARNRYLEEARTRRQALRERELVRARWQARARELQACRVQLARILERARILTPEIADSAVYRNALPCHAEEALSYLESVRARVRCRAEFGPILRPIVARHHNVELAIDDKIGPGVIAEAADGSALVDNTLAARLARIEPQITIELARQLRECE